MNSPVLPGRAARRDVRDNVGNSGEKNGRGELGGTQPSCDHRRWPWASARLIASPATTGSSTSRPSAMISEATDTCWISSPSRAAERHRQRGGNAQRHQHGGPPLPETDQRHQDHQADRFVQALHKQADVFLHLQRLIRCGAPIRSTASSTTHYPTGSRIRACIENRPICSPSRICTETVTARVGCHFPFLTIFAQV